MSDVIEAVRQRYAEKAVQMARGAACCDSSCCSDMECSDGYSSEELTAIGIDPSSSLGCGNPTLLADLKRGEHVLDLGSGAGLDVLLSARRVGPDGHAYGVDMTDEMLAVARENQAKARVANATFLKGTIEAIPLPDASVDVVISNCVINLSVDKPRVLREIARVLKPGGRVGVSDVVAEDRLSSTERAKRGSYVGCIAGALSVGEYRTGLEAAGLESVSIDLTHEVADGMHAAIVKAVKPT